MAQSKRTRADDDDDVKDTAVLHLVVMTHFEDGETSRVRHFFARVPREWLKGVDEDFVSARVNVDCGSVSCWLLSSRDDEASDDEAGDDEAGDEAGDEADDDEADDKKDDKKFGTPAYKLVERFVNFKNVAKAADFEQRLLWPCAEKRLMSSLKWYIELDETRAINTRFMHKTFSMSADGTQAYNESQKAIAAMRARLPELARAKIEEFRANNTLRQTMAVHDDAVSYFFAPAGCVPLDTPQPSAAKILHITLTFTR